MYVTRKSVGSPRGEHWGLENEAKICMHTNKIQMQINCQTIQLIRRAMEFETATARKQLLKCVTRARARTLHTVL